jgi:hypothetical protein
LNKKNPSSAAAFSAESTGKLGAYSSIRSGETTLMLGATQKGTDTTFVYQVNQKIGENTTRYLQSSGKSAILGINQSIGNGEGLTGNFFWNSILVQEKHLAGVLLEKVFSSQMHVDQRSLVNPGGVFCFAKYF